MGSSSSISRGSDSAATAEPVPSIVIGMPVPYYYQCSSLPIDVIDIIISYDHRNLLLLIGGEQVNTKGDVVYNMKTYVIDPLSAIISHSPSSSTKRNGRNKSHASVHNNGWITRLPCGPLPVRHIACVGTCHSSFVIHHQLLWATFREEKGLLRRLDLSKLPHTNVHHDGHHGSPPLTNSANSGSGGSGTSAVERPSFLWSTTPCPRHDRGVQFLSCDDYLYAYGHDIYGDGRTWLYRYDHMNNQWIRLVSPTHRGYGPIIGIASSFDHITHKRTSLGYLLYIREDFSAWMRYTPADHWLYDHDYNDVTCSICHHVIHDDIPIEDHTNWTTEPVMAEIDYPGDIKDVFVLPSATPLSRSSSSTSTASSAITARLLIVSDGKSKYDDPITKRYHIREYVMLDNRWQSLHCWTLPFDTQSGSFTYIDQLNALWYIGGTSRSKPYHLGSSHHSNNGVICYALNILDPTATWTILPFKLPLVGECVNATIVPWQYHC